MKAKLICNHRSISDDNKCDRCGLENAEEPTVFIPAKKENNECEHSQLSVDCVDCIMQMPITLEELHILLSKPKVVFGHGNIGISLTSWKDSEETNLLVLTDEPNAGKVGEKFNRTISDEEFQKAIQITMQFDNLAGIDALVSSLLELKEIMREKSDE